MDARVSLPVVPDGLPLEYKRDYRAASRNLGLLDFVNNPFANSKCRVFCLSFPKKVFNLTCSQHGMFGDNISHSFLVSENAAQALSKELFFESLSGGNVEAYAMKHECSSWGGSPPLPR